MDIDWPALCRDATQQRADAQLLAIRCSFGALTGTLILVAAAAARLFARFLRIPKAQRVNRDGGSSVWPLYARISRAFFPARA